MGLNVGLNLLFNNDHINLIFIIRTRWKKNLTDYTNL